MAPIHVVLSIIGSQTDLEGDKHQLEFFTEGELVQLDSGAWRIQYEETELSGMAGAVTSLTMHEGRVQLERSGEHSAMMQFDQGKRSTLLYATPSGVLEMNINPSYVFYHIDGHEGNLHLEYTLDIQGQRAGSNEMKVHFRPSQSRE